MAPKKKRSGAAAAPRVRTPARYHAPELRPEVLRAILLPLAGDISTLCAAACVNKSWRDAALHPRLWAKLQLRPSQIPIRAEGRVVSWRTSCVVTDERLAMLVRRACAVDADGNAHTLLSLRATHSVDVTLRGVLAALRGPRTSTGAMLLKGAMRTLFVAGVKHRFTSGDSRLIKSLSGFLRPPRNVKGHSLDVLGGITACTRKLRDSYGQDIESVCGRVASTAVRACGACSIALCGQCCYHCDRDTCEHMCSGCGRWCDEDELGECKSCQSLGRPSS